MNEDEFWQIIQRSFDSCDGDIYKQADALAEELDGLPPTEIASFDQIFEQQRRKAYTWDLWGAAYIIAGGCSDDGFEYFLRWLISRGKEWFERALRDPDALADYPVTLSDEDVEFEEFAYVADKVYEAKTGQSIPHTTSAPFGDPAGEPWEEETEVLAARWPKLAAKYSS